MQISGSQLLLEGARFEALARARGSQVIPGEVYANLSDTADITIRTHPDPGSHIERQVELMVADRKNDRIKVFVDYNYGPEGTFMDRVIHEKGSGMDGIREKTTVMTDSASIGLHMFNGFKGLDAESRAILGQWPIAY